jgi:hypothetical protein
MIQTKCMRLRLPRPLEKKRTIRLVQNDRAAAFVPCSHDPIIAPSYSIARQIRAIRCLYCSRPLSFPHQASRTPPPPQNLCLCTTAAALHIPQHAEKAVGRSKPQLGQAPGTGEGILVTAYTNVCRCGRSAMGPRRRIRIRAACGACCVAVVGPCGPAARRLPVPHPTPIPPVIPS